MWLWNNWFVDGPHGAYRWVGMDFASYWVGVREMFFNGGDPYSTETTLKIQKIVYGGPALGEDPMLFSYPAWLFIVILPFVLIPYEWAAILWVGTLLWAMLNLFYKIGSMLGGNRFHNQSFFVISLFLGNLPFLSISVIKGQLGVLSLLSLFFAYQMRNSRPVLAGVILAFALIKPTSTVVPVVAFLLWTLLQKNQKIFFGFITNMTVMLTTSFWAIGNWVPSYFSMLDVKMGIEVFWSLEILRFPWNVLYALVFIGIFMTQFYVSFKTDSEHWFASAILLGIALTPMRWIYDLFLGILIFARGRISSTYQFLIIIIAIFSPWYLVFVPEIIRWNVAVVCFPLIWLITFLILNFTKETSNAINQLL